MWIGDVFRPKSFRTDTMVQVLRHFLLGGAVRNVATTSLSALPVAPLGIKCFPRVLRLLGRVGL